MTDPAYLTARFTLGTGTVTAEFRLTLDNPLHEVWAALTEPGWLAQWLAPGEIELRPGGAARVDFGESGGTIESRVTAFEPQRLLEYSWSTSGEPERPLRWWLEPIGPTTQLTLSLTVPADEDAGRGAPGNAADRADRRSHQVPVRGLPCGPRRLPRTGGPAACGRPGAGACVRSDRAALRP